MGKSDLEAALVKQLEWEMRPAPVPQYRAVAERRWKWDLAWPAHNLLVEVDGGQYTGGRHQRPGRWGADNDAEKQSTAAALGWVTMRFTRKMIEDSRAVELICLYLDTHPADARHVE